MIAEEILNMKDSIEDINHVYSMRKKARLKPYELQANIKIQFVSETTYEKMLKDDESLVAIRRQSKRYFPEFKQTLFLFNGQIKEIELKWSFWRHPKQINQFFRQAEQEIQKIQTSRARESKFSSSIVQKFKQLKEKWSPKQIEKVVQWFNMALEHPYLKKSVNVLNFVEHCLPSNLWNLHIYQQAQVRDHPNFIEKFQNKPGSIKQFLTVTTDGIIRSSKNLLVSKIDRMVPFTNQFSCSIRITQCQLYFEVNSCKNQSFRVNFLNDYMTGINIYIGTKNAFKATGLDKKQEKINRFGSFSKIRQNCFAKLYNDGVEYFQDMFKMLNNARNQVLITDWWLTPYFMLKRPNQISNKHFRLDGVLKKIADRGVRVFIILFREPMNILCNDSEQAHFYLESLSRNIRVRRHPIIPQLWSHHEKSCIIDQTYGFMGGLDICYGRWDTPDHHIHNKDNLWDGADYSNQRLRPYAPGTTSNFQQSAVDRRTQPRMPWHDIGLHVQGDAVIDLARHFIQYWNYVDQQKSHDYVAVMRTVGKRCERSYKYDTYNEKGDQDQFFINQEEKKDHTCGEKLKMMRKGTVNFFKGVDKRLPELLIEVRQNLRAGQMQLQLCRSASPWSIGAIQHQQSIHNAYQDLIQNSEQLIYIQNQFFMGTQNKIVDCLQKRIRRAHLKKQNFKVVVVMPLLPGFDGQINDPKSGSLRIQVHNQYQSINRGPNALFKKLSDLQDFHIHNYIFFFGLRNHAIIGGKPITQIIYVHSKLMIVDDKRAIIGSANINDRSLLGVRDSQLAMVIEQNNGKVLKEKVEKLYIYDLRKRLFQQHFALKPQQILNINQPQNWATMIANAKNNTLIYRHLFGCYPDDLITVGNQVQPFKKQPTMAEYQSLTSKLVGHAVEFSLEFMKDDNLEFRFGDKEGLLGNQAFL